jgi:hypothetical protein
MMKWGVYLANCFEIREKCGVKNPSRDVCKDTKRCQCWSDSVGCKGIFTIKLERGLK